MKNHEHTLVDHRPGGAEISLGLGAWCAIGIAHVRADRAGAAVSAYESLVEAFYAENAGRRSAAILRSIDHRRVIAAVELEGHVAFRHLASAWDAHHLFAQHRANAESMTLGFYKVVAAAGDARIVPGSPDRYVFERIARAPSHTGGVLEAAARAFGFRGALILEADGDGACIVLYRFEHEADFEAFRSSAAAVEGLGEAGAIGETSYSMQPVKTFGASA